MEETLAKEISAYDLKNDWKFVSIVQFVNLFKNVIAVDPISTLELENSLKHPEIEPQCLNILLKLIMKKALFKPHLKIGENFELKNFEDMLLKKINFLYKSYIRYLKKVNSVTDNSKVFELLKRDIEEYRERKEKGIHKLNANNLSDNQFEDMDIKTLMIVEFFRSIGGRNPFLKTSLQAEKIDMFLNLDDKEEIEKVEKTEKNEQTVANLEVTYLTEDFLTFNGLSIEDKVDILFFFCNYSLTLSGRSNLFREELQKDAKDPINSHINFKRVKPLGKDSDYNVYYSLLCNKDCRVYRETDESGIELVVKNYEELEKFLVKLEADLNSEDAGNKNKKTKDFTKDLIKNIKDNLLIFKDNNEEELKKEANLVRKQQALEKAKMLKTRQGGEIDRYATSDYYLMNISDKVITRNQLNRITKTTLNNNLSIPLQQSKPQIISEDEKKRIKIEKEKIERDRRLEKRNRIFEKRKANEHNGMLNSKRHRNRLGRRKAKGDSSEDEYPSSASYSENVPKSKSHNSQSDYELGTDREDMEEEEGQFNEIYSALDDNPSGEANDIILEGNLIYRFINNQVELDGTWFMSHDMPTKEKLSFLFQKSFEYLECPISSHEIIYNSDNNSIKDFTIKICCSNLHECIIINKLSIFNSVLKFLSGEYAGYFMYYGKTIEDRVNLNLSLEDSLVRINGEGTNNLGNFSVIGYMNFYRNKEFLLEKNDLETDVIKLAEFKLTKIYTAFNPNENYRVIKSYQHRRKRLDNDDTFY